jgi:hypothetical protein
MNQKVDIGKFDRKVSFKTPTSTKTAMGAPSKSYVHSFYLYMSRVPLQTEEQVVDKRLVIAGKYKYTGHYKSSVNETLQMVDAGIKYNILSVNPIDDKKMFIEIIAERITE